MPFLELEHSLIHYEEQGEGTPLVLIHGACESSSFWKAQLIELQLKNKLILLDLPGHGQSAKPSADVSIPMYAGIVSDVIQGLVLESPILVGHSMGGAVAMTVAVEKPDLLSRVILANTGAKLGVLPQILAGLETDFAETIRTIVAPKELGERHVDQLLQWVSDEMVLTDSKVGLEDFLACSRFDLRGRLEEIKTPSLIISGDQDQMTPVRWSAYLNEKIPDSEFAVIQGTGHLTMLERPEAFNEILGEFLSRHAV